MCIDLSPKPITGDWNGSGAHHNFSTNTTRAEGGLEYIKNHCMKKLEQNHNEHIELYGIDNHKRLTGSHETSSIKKFTVGHGCRGSSVRIPVVTIEKESGYFEDRRPASNIDPYLTTAVLVDTICLNNKYQK